MSPENDAAPPLDANPYAPPAATAPPSRGARAVYRGKPRPWTTGEVLGLARKRFGEQQWKLAGAKLLWLGIPQLPVQSLRVFFSPDAQGAVPPESVRSYILATIAAELASLLLSVYFTSGACKMWLDVARGKRARFGDLFAGVARTPSMAGALTLQTLAVVAGFVCLIVPGFVLMAGLCLTPYFVVDAEMGPFRAVAASWEVTRGHRVALIGFWLVAMLILLAGVLACGVGVLVAYPFVYVAAAIVYLRLTGRKERRRAGA